MEGYFHQATQYHFVILFLLHPWLCFGLHTSLARNTILHVCLLACVSHYPLLEGTRIFQPRPCAPEGGTGTVAQVSSRSGLWTGSGGPSFCPAVAGIHPAEKRPGV